MRFSESVLVILSAFISDKRIPMLSVWNCFDCLITCAICSNNSLSIKICEVFYFRKNKIDKNLFIILYSAYYRKRYNITLLIIIIIVIKYKSEFIKIIYLFFGAMYYNNMLTYNLIKQKTNFICGNLF